MTRVSSLLGTVSATAILTLGFTAPAAAQDADAARALAQSNNCIQCHGIKKDKDAPSFLKIAEKYKGKASAEDELVKHITSGKKVKLLDGSMEDHKVAKTIPPNDAAQLKNLVKWVLATQ
jgi:cytochrome c